MFENIVDLPQSIRDSLAQTHGILLYQEQVIEISKAFAGLTEVEADSLRKAMGKKDAKLMAKLKNTFVEGAIRLGHKQKDAEEIFDVLDKYSSYSFNKSHSLAYSLISYQTAWLKRYYPVHFFAATINSKLESTEKREILIQKILEEAKEMGISIVSPDINISDYECRARNNILYLGLGCIKGLGDGFGRSVVEERSQNGIFESNLSKTCDRLWKGRILGDKIKLLIRGGVLDSFGFTRLAMLEMVPIIEKNRKRIQAKQRVKLEKNKATPEFFKEIEEMEIIKETKEFPLSVRLADEQELYGFSLSGSALSAFIIPSTHIDDLDFIGEGQVGEKISLALFVAKEKVITTKAGKKMAFLTAEDKYGKTIEITVFPRQWTNISERISSLQGKGVVVFGKLEKVNGPIILDSYLVLAEKE